MSVEAVIFDVDGTIVDTSEYIHQAYEYALGLHGETIMSRTDISRQIGRRLEEAYAFFAPNADHAMLVATHREFQGKNPHLIQPFGYADLVMSVLRRQGRRLALFTSRRNVAPSLEYVGLDPKIFEVVVDGSMVEQGKPDPEGIHSILGRMGLNSTQVVIVGDAGVDIQAGKNASLRATIGITHGFGTKEELTEAGADHIIDSLAVLPALIESIERRDDKS